MATDIQRTSELSEVVKTSVAAENAFALSVDEWIHERDKWEELVNYRLIEWGRDRSILEEDGLEAPSAEAICEAIRLANFLRKRRFAAPLRVVPTGEGGIAFVWVSPTYSLTFEVSESGAIEYYVLENFAVVARASVPAELLRCDDEV